LVTSRPNLWRLAGMGGVYMYLCSNYRFGAVNLTLLVN
jgi:hypothetical protein